jgi:hypothetical protein
MTKKQTTLTLEVFEKVLMPQINKKIEDLKVDINHLPTKKEYYAREDKTMGELKKLGIDTSTVF